MTHTCPVSPARNVEDIRKGRNRRSACAVPVDDARAICVACTADLEQALAELPALVADLESTLARQTGRGSGNGSRSAVRPLPYDVRAGQVLGSMRAVLVGWVRDLDEDPQHQPADTLPAMCEWLFARVGAIAVHVAADEIHREILDAYAAGVRAVDIPPDRLFLGRCPDCTLEDIYARPEDVTTRCRNCGNPHDVATLRSGLLAGLDDKLVTAAEFATLAAYSGPVDRTRIRTLIGVWASREPRLRAVPGPTGPRYRFGDIQARMARMAEKKRGTA